MRYHANSALLIHVSFGKGSQFVSLEPGAHDLFFSISGGANNLEIIGARPDAGLCVASVTVGNLDVEVPPVARPRS
jgi:hypothetical protein